MKDPQRHLVYAMERLEFGGHWRHKLTNRTAKRWIRQACKNLGVKAPKVIVKTIRGVRGEYDEDSRTIYLDTEYGRSGLVLLHELAHHVAYVKYPRSADHGPMWMRVYATLLDMSRLVPIAGTKAACRRHGVKIARRLA
jgi:hypothetical protein